MKKFLAIMLMLGYVCTYAQNPKLIKNLAGTTTEPYSNSKDFWTTNQWNGLFFYQGKGTPTKLCVTDGTDAGTKFILDMGAGDIHKIIPAKDFVYIITSQIISASPFTTRFEIWKSNGTAAGTSLVKALADVVGFTNSYQFCSDPNGIYNFCLDGTTNQLFFAGYDAVNGNELWVTDGTAAGTTIVKDIKPGTGGSLPWGFMKIGNEVFFNCAEVGLERKLWKTDGTAAGTVKINVPEPFFIVNGPISKLGNKMIMFANNTTDGYEPYVSDGTAAGTFMLGNFHPSGNSLTPYVDEANMKSNSKYCFLILQNGVDTSLYRTDGTAAGTIRIAAAGMSVYTRVSSGGYVEVDENGIWIVRFNNMGSGNSEKIYRSNGTAAGTYLVAENISYGQKVKIYKNALWMQARNIGANANSEPWRSGGNAASTNKAFEVAPGLAPFINTPFSSDPYGFFVTNNKLYFFAKNAASNIGLYEYNGDFTFNGSVAGGNWKDSANWNSVMPPGITDTVIINTGTPNAITINGAKAFAGILNMQSNASVNLANASDSLIVNTKMAANANNSFTGAGALVLRNANADTIAVENGFSAGNLSIESNSNLLNGNIVISSTLTLSNNGNLVLNNNQLTLSGNTSTATASATSYIVTNGTGKMQIENVGTGARTGTVLFPVGNTTYNPVLFANSGTADVFGARVTTGISTTYTGETPGTLLTSSAVNRTWMITESTTGGSNATITLQWNAADELPSFDRNATTLGHYTGGAWTVGGTSAAAGTNPYTYSRAGITSFSPFGILNSIATPVSNFWRNSIYLNVYPNPAKSLMYVTLTEQMQKETLQIQLLNATGQLVMQQQIAPTRNSNFILNMNTLNEGVYYLFINGKTVRATATVKKIN
jgi:ELWxxDGT repeat protein